MRRISVLERQQVGVAAAGGGAGPLVVVGRRSRAERSNGGDGAKGHGSKTLEKCDTLGWATKGQQPDRW